MELTRTALYKQHVTHTRSDGRATCLAAARLWDVALLVACFGDSGGQTQKIRAPAAHSLELLTGYHRLTRPTFGGTPDAHNTVLELSLSKPLMGL